VPDLVDVVSILNPAVIERFIGRCAESRVHPVLDVEEVEIVGMGIDHTLEERHGEAGAISCGTLD
jgi:hypothetical protein